MQREYILAETFQGLQLHRAYGAFIGDSFEPYSPLCPSLLFSDRCKLSVRSGALMLRFGQRMVPKTYASLQASVRPARLLRLSTMSVSPMPPVFTHRHQRVRGFTTMGHPSSGFCKCTSGPCEASHVLLQAKLSLPLCNAYCDCNSVRSARV